MKLTTHIRNLILLWRERNKIEIPKNADAEVMLRVTKNAYKRKNSWVRNQAALLIRKIRKEKPYKVQDYSKARQFYENQPKGIDFSKVKEGNYVVKFTEEYAVKGKRYCEYYINFTSRLDIFEVGKWNEKYESFALVDSKDRWGIYSLDREDDIMFRFATKEEIEQFKIARKNYKQKKKEIDALQKQITKLYKEL